MNAWAAKLTVWNMRQILEAVDDAKWQKFRLSLKGIATTEKLLRLSDWLDAAFLRDGAIHWKDQCRVDNYVNALKRGGQLTVDGKVQR